MSVDINSSVSDRFSGTSSLIYDADGVTLLGCYGDELSAYRARRAWVKALSNFFLLEKERDYELSISIHEDKPELFIMRAEFISACGRYAFWRLINHQAPEVEEILSSTPGGVKAKRQTISQLVKTNCEDPWIINTDDSDQNPAPINLISKFMLFFSPLRS